MASAPAFSARSTPACTVKSLESDVMRGWSTCSYVPQSIDSEFQITVLCCHYYTGNKKRLQNISRHAIRCTQEEENILCCSIADCCTISSSKCLGMLKPLNKLQSIPCFVLILGRIGASWEIPDDLMDKLVVSVVNHECEWAALHLLGSTASTLEASKSIDFTNLPQCPRWLSYRSNM